MKILENKVVCILIMCVLIIAGLFLGGYKSLNGLYNDAAEIFFVGEYNDGICVANDMAERSAAATNMITISSDYPGFNESVDAQAMILRLSKANTDLTASISVQSKENIANAISANKKLDAAMTEVYHALGKQQLSASDEKYRQKLYADFNSRNDTISHDPYNSYAQKYNSVLADFPANIIASVMPVKSLPVAY